MSSDGKSLRVDEQGKPGQNSLGCRYSWVKMSQPSIESLRQAFLDSSSRIRPMGENPELRRHHGRMVSLRIVNTAFMADQDLHFSPNLSCIIGGRGAGKSSVLEYLRFCVRQEGEPQAKEQIDRLKRTLKPESALCVVWESPDGLRDTFEYRLVSGRAQVVGREVTEPETVFKNLDVQVFSQGQITRIAKLDEDRREPTFLLPLLDRLCGEPLEQLKREERRLVDQLKEVFRQQTSLDRLVQERDELQQELAELNRQWQQRSAIQEEGKQYRQAQEARRSVERVRREAEDTVQELRQQAQEVVEGDSPLGSAVANWPHTEWFQAVDAGVQKAREQLREEVSRALDRFADAVRALTAEHERWPEVDQALRTAEERFLAACEAQGLKPEEVGRLREVELQRKGKSLEKERKDQEILALKQTLARAGELLGDLHELWHRQWETRKRCLGAILESESIPKVPVDPANPGGDTRPFIEVQFDYGQDLSHFLELWSQLIRDRRKRLGREWERIGQEFLEAFQKSEDPKASVWGLIHAGLTGSAPLPEGAREFADELKQELRGEIREEWERTRLTRVRDHVDLTLYRKDGTRAGSLRRGELSDGQRNTAVLSLLLAQGTGPVIIDQPEEELDSDFIFNELVPLIRFVKERRQVILVTHNANLPVNGDAELVYALSAQEGRGTCRTQGGLDREAVKNAVLDIMEGSDEAFRRRREKYHY